MRHNTLSQPHSQKSYSLSCFHIGVCMYPLFNFNVDVVHLWRGFASFMQATLLKRYFNATLEVLCYYYFYRL